MEDNLFKLYFEGDSEFVMDYEIEKIILFRTKQFKNLIMSTKKIKHISNSFIESLCEKYRRGFLKGYPIKRSSYTLSLVTKDTREMYEDEEVHKNIYSLTIDTENNTIEKYLNYDIDFPGDYYIEICVCLQTEIYENVSEEEFYNFRMYDENYRNIKKQKPYIEAFKVELCCICYESKPNILYLDCLHLSICNECQKKGNFKNCQLCRKKITHQIKI